MAEQGSFPTLQRTSNTRSKLKFGELKRSQSQSNTMRTVHSAQNRRYENVEKITMLLGDVALKEPSRTDRKVHEVVVEGFKQRIRSTFNELYGDYDKNKEVISNEIRNLEKNKTSHIEMNARLEQTLKEKNQYDKIRLEVSNKQKQLQKMRQLVDSAVSTKSENERLYDQLKIKVEEMREHEDVLDNLDYQRSVLENMRLVRRTLKQELKKKFDALYGEFSEKSRMIRKFYDDSEVKKKLVSDLSKQIPESQVEIPENFAIQLEDKLEILYGKEAFQNIFYHQNIINQVTNREEMEREMQERDERRKFKQQVEREEKRELDRVETEYLKNQALEENFMKQCGVRSLDEIINNNSEENREALRHLKQELQEKMRAIEAENQAITDEITNVLSKNTNIEVSIRDIQSEYNDEHERELRLSYQDEKNNNFLEGLESIIDRITEEPGPIEDMNLKLASFSSKFQRFSVLSSESKRDKRPKFSRVLEVSTHNDDTENIDVSREEEYLEVQFQNAKQS